MNHLIFSLRRVQFVVALILVSAFTLFTAYSQTTIASEGFENALTLFTQSGTSTYKTGNSGSGGSGVYPFNTNYFSVGSYGLQVNNTVVTLTTTNNINTSTYACVTASLDIASFSGTSGNGADAGDSISVLVSTNGGTSYGRALKLTGSSSNNAYWGFAATGSSTTAYGTYLSTAAASTSGSVTSAVSRITITNLPASSTLKFKIVIGNDGSNEFWVVDNFNVQGYSFPSTQVSGMSNAAISENGASLSWTNGNGNASLVTVRPTANSLLAPSCGVTYTPNAAYGSAGQLNTNNRAVYASTGTSVSVTGLSAQTQYTATGYSYNTGGYYNTGSAASSSFYTLSNPATAAPSSLAGTGISTSQIDLSWTAATYPASGATAKGYILVRRQDGTNPTNTGIVNGVSPASLSLASGTTLVSTITSGTTVSYSNTGLTANTSYNYLLIPFTWDGTNTATYNYYTTSAPTVAVSTTNGQVVINSPAVSNIASTSATLGATIVNNGGNNITDYGVYWSTSTGVSTSSTKSSNGTSNITGAYSGTLGSLSAATQYFFKGYATNSVGTTLTSSEQSFYTLSTSPSAYPASFSASASSSSQITLSFSKLNTLSTCAGYLIVQSTAASLGAAPVNGSSYSVGSTIGNGTVAFVNTTNGAQSANISGLNASTTYYYFLFPYNWDWSNVATYNYLTGSAPSANATTLAPPAPIISSLSASTGYYGSTLSIYGANMNIVNSLSIGGVNMTNYSIVSNTQIDITINNASANGAVVLNHSGGSVTGSSYTVNGYITNAALTYTTASCWLGGVVPPAGSVVNIAHAITVPSIALASAPTSVRILNGGAMTTTSGSTGYQTAALTIDAGGTLTVGPNAVWNINAGGLTNNGTINLGNTFGGTIKITGGSFVNNSTFNQGTGKLDFTGTCTLSTANTTLYNLDVNGALTLPTGIVVNNVLNMNSGASLVGNGLTYGATASVSYNASRSPGLEWPINTASGTTIPNTVTVAAAATVTLNGTGTHQVKGNLVLNGTLVLSGSNDIAVSGDISGTGTLTSGTRKFSFNGTTQNLNAALSFYDVDVLCSNLYVGAGTTINNKLTLSANDTLTTKLGFTLSIQSSALNPSIINGTFINQGSITVGNTGGFSVANGATFIHNAVSAISTNLSRTILSTGSTFVYRGNSALIPAMSISNRTYHNLRFESTSGSWVDNIGFTGSNNCTINGDLFVGNGVTLLNASFSGTWNIAGNMQVDGVMPSSRINATLTGAQDTISGSGTIRFGTLSVSGNYELNSNMSVTTASVSGSLYTNNSIVSGTTFTLGATGTLGIGHLQGIASSGNQGNIQTTNRTFPSTASYVYDGTASQSAGSGLPATVANLTVNNTGTGSNNMVTLAQTTTVTNTLNLLDGHFAATGSIVLVVSNTAVNAITGYASMALANNSSYVEGNLRRKVTTGVYDFPLGTSQNYQLATITVNSNTNVDNILVYFDKFASGCGYTGNTPSFYAKPSNGSQSGFVDDMLNFGYYTVEPYNASNVLVTTPNISYDAQMLFNGHNNGISGYANVNSYYTLMKKPACGGAWGLYGGSFATSTNQAQNSNSGAVALKLQGLVSFSQFGAGFSSSTVLPLETTGFTGEQTKDGNALTWTTLSEEATIKFVIERSENADDFTAIGEVAAKGARNSGADYNFLDAKAGTGIHYYRLKAVDVDGNVSYSEMIALGSKGNISNFNVYPNPAANEIHFAYQLMQANTQATLKVYSMNGALMHAETLTKNNQEYLLDTRDYQNGLYFYEVIAGGQKLYTGKFNISK